MSKVLIMILSFQLTFILLTLMGIGMLMETVVMVNLAIEIQRLVTTCLISFQMFLLADSFAHLQKTF